MHRQQEVARPPETHNGGALSCAALQVSPVVTGHMLMLTYYLYLEAVHPPRTLGCIDAAMTPFAQQLSTLLGFEVRPTHSYPVITIYCLVTGKRMHCPLRSDLLSAAISLVREKRPVPHC